MIKKLADINLYQQPVVNGELTDAKPEGTFINNTVKCISEFYHIKTI